VGLPNAGKSTFLAAASAAKPKIADYPFTTLEPNLGVVALDDDTNFVVADIPGLIEGASEGRGLGHQFLRHIERARVLCVLIDLTSSAAEPDEQEQILLNELEQYRADLLDRPRLVVGTKADAVQRDELERLGWDRPIISAVTGQGLRELVGQMAALVHAARDAEPAPEGFVVIRPEPTGAIVERVDAREFRLVGREVERVVALNDVTTPEVRNAVADLERKALASGEMNPPIEVETNRGGTVTRVEIPLAGNGTNDASNAALATLRNDLLPATIGRLDGVEYAVTGQTANSQDFNESQTSSAPKVFGFVLLFAFGLLLLSFRSIVIALKAIVLNLLSVAAAYGVLVAIFQWGWGENLLDFQSNGGIANWLPMFMFVILFGLSMDYHVFILSRIREAYDRGLSTDDAISHGIKSTAGVVTSAAIVMVAVFSIFATLSMMMLKQFGVGLAVAVLIDATIVRAVLLPASMKLLGDWNWYLPRWLEWLPRVDPTEPEASKPAPAPASV